MKQLIILITFMTISLGSSLAKNYPQLIMAGDYPDPTILRDGNDYYMTHSPFVYAPGFLIWHSTDLINWEPFTRTDSEIRGSAYAPDLIKHDDKYYIYYPASGTNWVIWADDIKGPWSAPIDLNISRIDPGHVVGQDGKRYLHVSGGMVHELSDDGLSGVGEMKQSYKGWRYPKEWITECFCLESPKLNYKDGYYYMTSAQGGTAGPATSHMVVSARSKSATGPWENSPHNPIVHTYDANEYWWSKGHGTIVDDANGDWWIVYHAYRKDAYTLGRHTLIDPIKWTEDGWYKLDEDREAITPRQQGNEMPLSDDFSSGELGIQWTTWGGFPKKDIALKNGSVFLQGKGGSTGYGRKLFITAPRHNYQISAEVELQKEGNGGLILYYRDNSFASITSDGKDFIIENAAKEVKRVANIIGNHFHLKLINQKDLCSLQVSKDGKQWETLQENLDVSGLHHNNYRGFFALRAGLVASGKGKVRFDNFQFTSGKLAPKPAFRDPVYDGAADPIVIWNPILEKWWMFYTNRRATETHLPGVSWVFKTPIGIAESEDGANWNYVGNANFPNLPPEAGGDSATLWAPDIVYGDDGLWHMFMSTQAGIAERWGKVPGYIDHFTSNNLRDWIYIERFDLPVGSYDADAIKMKDGTWRLYYKDPSNGASTFYYLETKDFAQWSSPHKVLSIQGEGPTVFFWKDYYWMILCDGRGMTTLRSTDANTWEKQPGGPLMPHGTGRGLDDRTTARHGEIVISNERAYLYYFTHPGRIDEGYKKDGFDQRRSSIQVVELQLKDNWIEADRNKATFVDLKKPQ